MGGGPDVIDFSGIDLGVRRGEVPGLRRRYRDSGARQAGNDRYIPSQVAFNLFLGGPATTVRAAAPPATS